jgi:hypothetical protein
MRKICGVHFLPIFQQVKNAAWPVSSWLKHNRLVITGEVYFQRHPVPKAGAELVKKVSGFG